MSTLEIRDLHVSVNTEADEPKDLVVHAEVDGMLSSARRLARQR